MDKFLTKENILVTAMVIFTLTQMNFFATKLDLAELKLELKDYTNNKSEETAKLITDRFDNLDKKIDDELKSRR